VKANSISSAEVNPPDGTGGVDPAEAGSIDVVTFVVEGETYAFPMERVEEIIRMPQTVRVPLGPASLKGLANLRGRVLPIVSLRACCGLPDVEHDEATRVIVVDGLATLGFVVDRVASVTSVDVARLEPADRIGGAITSDLLSGVIKPVGPGDELIKLLDVARLVTSQFATLGLNPQSRAEVAPGVITAAGGAGEPSDDDTLELVSFAVDGQEYALPIDLVQEIVQAPERVTTVPNAESRVLGVMDLRGRLLPVVSLREVFGLPQAALEPQNRIVVVQLPGTDGGSAVVGIVMDTVREVLRVPHDLVAELPAYMARAGRAQEVELVCRLEDGKRLVSVLSVDKMFARPELQAALAEVAAGQEDGTSGEDGDVAVTRDGESEDELLVVFRLSAEEYSVDVDTVQEIIRVPETLIRVPKALDFVEGLVNLRGAVLPVVDLRTRLGLPRGERDERQRIIVLIVNGVRTGFIVDSVTEVLRVSRTDLEPAPELSGEQSHLINRVANLTGSQRMLMMLEPDHLLAVDQMSALIPQPRDNDGALRPEPEVEVAR
jgi:purine-binding chemotaxis protein CheW